MYFEDHRQPPPPASFKEALAEITQLYKRLAQANEKWEKVWERRMLDRRAIREELNLLRDIANEARKNNTLGLHAAVKKYDYFKRPFEPLDPNF